MRLRLDGRRAPHARPKQHKPSLRRWTLPKLLDAVRVVVLASDYSHGVTVDEIALKLRAKRGLVHQCFHKLNLEGVLSQGSNGLMEEIRRGPINPYSGWVDTIYTLMRRVAK